MDANEWEQMFRQTIADAKLSKGERKALKANLSEAALDEHNRGVLRALAFDVARSELNAQAELLDWLEDVNKLLLPPTGDDNEHSTQVYFSPGEACAQRIIGTMKDARGNADICVFTITDDRVTGAIIDAHQRGVNVRVISDDEKAGDMGSDVRRMAAAGIPVRVDGSPYHMHHKFAVVDGGVVLTGSYNWTVSAAKNNEENMVVSNDRKLVLAFSEEFERLWKDFAGNAL